MRYLIALLSLFALANAQFGGFFDQMFGNSQGGGGHEHHHQSHSQNNPSDASHYRTQHDQCMFSINPFKIDLLHNLFLF